MVVADTLLIGDLSVRRLGFGTTRLTGPGTWGAPSDQSAAKKVLRRALELGVNLSTRPMHKAPGSANA